MQLNEIGAVILFGFGGYWAVSWWLGRGDKPRASREQGQEVPPRAPPPREPPRQEAPRGEPPPRDPPPQPDRRRPWYDVLKVPPTAGAEEIKASYRRLIAQYHPDKVATLAPEFRALAEEKSKELNAAYEAGTAAASRR
jgi:DnaJ like chaperone protein